MPGTEGPLKPRPLLNQAVQERQEASPFTLGCYSLVFGIILSSLSFPISFLMHSLILLPKWTHIFHFSFNSKHLTEICKALKEKVTCNTTVFSGLLKSVFSLTNKAAVVLVHHISFPHFPVSSCIFFLPTDLPCLCFLLSLVVLFLFTFRFLHSYFHSVSPCACVLVTFIQIIEHGCEGILLRCHLAGSIHFTGENTGSSVRS